MIDCAESAASVRHAARRRRIPSVRFGAVDRLTGNYSSFCISPHTRMRPEIGVSVRFRNPRTLADLPVLIFSSANVCSVSLPHSTRYDCVVPVFDNLVSLQVSRESMCLRSDLLDDIPYRVCDGIRSVLMHTMT
jgi:hypothetical protein